MGTGLYQSAQRPSSLRPTANTRRQMAKVGAGRENNQKLCCPQRRRSEDKDWIPEQNQIQPRESQPRGQNQPAPHHSDTPPFPRGIQDQPPLSDPSPAHWSTQPPQAGQPNPSAATAAPATEVCTHLNYGACSFCQFTKNRPPSEGTEKLLLI